MSEKQSIYEAAADQLAEAGYVSEAVEMLGAGYDQPAVEIEQPRTVIQRREGKLQAVDRPAFIKLSTDFKNELAGISGDALKVWIFVSLSINRKSGRANPGLRTIADGVGLAVNTVQKALKELEAVNLLAVYRGEKRYNLYEIPEYVSANRSEPSVSNRDTDLQTVSNPDETVSNSAQTVSPSVILNQKNQRNKKGDILDGMSYFAQQAQERGVDKVEDVLVRLDRGISANIHRSLANQSVAKRILREEAEGHTVEKFLAWLRSDEWRMAHLYIYADLEKMWTLWPQAFTAPSDEYTGQPKPHAL